MIRTLRLCLALLAALGAAGAARAAAVASAHARTELIAESQGAAPGSTVWVAVSQTLDKGWHTYWRNPGDAGEPTTLRWTLPAGWKAGDIVWPTPKRLPVGPIMNYGYEGKVLLAVPVQIPADTRVGDQARISVAVDYLVCAEVCVPGAVTVETTLPVVSGAPQADPVWGAAIARALADAPKPGAIAATYQSVSGTLKLSMAGEALKGASGVDAYFYPYSDSLIDHAKPQTIDRGPTGLTLSMTEAAGFAKAPPAKTSGVLVTDGKAFEVNAAPGSPVAGASGLGPPMSAGGAAAGGILLAAGGAFLGGLILNLMPCVFPILSIKVVSLAGHAGDTRMARGQALAFLVGVLITFMGLAGALIAARAAGSAVGWGFQLQSPAAVAVLGLIMLAAALNLSGLFEIGTSAQGLGSGLAARGDWIGAVFTGVLAVVVAAPCTAPFMGPALGFALTQAWPVALAVFVALGLGFAAPFTVLSLTPALIHRLPRPGPWMEAFKKTLAFPMYAAAAWLVWVLTQQAGPDGLARMLAAAVTLALAAWLFGAAQRRNLIGRDTGVIALSAAALAAFVGALGLVTVGAYAAPPAAGPAPIVSAGALPTEPWSPERLAAARAAHKPVLVNFTAAWCVTCQVNERVAFSSPDVQAAFRRSGAVYLVGDWTNRNADIAKALSDQGRIGVPLYLLYGADGAPPKALPQLLTPAMVAQALDEAARPRA